jgi:hypothetical protein
LEGKRGESILCTLAVCLSVWSMCFIVNAQMTDVLTYHNDSARTGQALNEQILTPANVNTNHFGLLWVLPVDGNVDAQPLYAAGVSIPGKGEHNVLVVATEHDSVYGFDADSTNIFWHVSMLEAGETTSDDRDCSQVEPEIGVTATPVIDRQLGPNGTIFVVAMSKSGSTYFQRIHALDLATGTNVAAAVTVAAQYPGIGDSSNGTNVLFLASQYKERAGLLLLNGVIYTAWASHCDIRPYTGWIMGYDERTLTQTNVLNVTPNGNEGAIWMSGDGLASDSSNNIYFLDGNGTFDPTLTANGFPTDGDFGNAFIKLSTSNNVLAVADYFATYTNAYENDNDLDLGSGGELVLPDMIDSLGHTRQLAVGAGKDENIYLVDRNNMGKFNPTNNDAIYQEVTGVLGGGVYSTPAYFNGTLYYGASGEYIKALPFQNARLTAVSSQTPGAFEYPGATPGVSANGTSNAILWAAENTTPVVLHAYAATNLTVELYNSNQAPGGRDQFGVGNKFITPTIASARVYVGATNNVGVFGLLDTSTLTPIEVWRNTYFGNPSNVGAGADAASPAGDGIPNLIKYALGLNPLTLAIGSQLPVPSILSVSGQNYLELIVNRTAQATDVTYTVQVSSNLQSWVSGSPSTVLVTNLPTQLIVRDNTPVMSAISRFIRFQVSDP